MSQGNSKANGRIEVRKEYYTSGALYSETPYVNGEKNGLEKGYFESGALSWETPYKEGRQHGTEKGYYDSGALMCETPFLNGKVHGLVKSYDKEKSNIYQLTLYSKNRILLSLRREGYRVY